MGEPAKAMSSRLAGLFVHCLHGDDKQGSWSGKDSIGGTPFSHFLFRNSNVPSHYFCDVHIDSKMVQCRLLVLRKGSCRVGTICSHVDILCRMATLRNGSVPLMNFH